MLTEPDIRAALKRGADTQLSDGKGRGNGRLVLRIRAGQGTWYAQQWVNNRRRLTQIGFYPAVTLAKARAEFATTYLPKIATGDDIRGTPPTGTVANLFADYVAYLRSKGKRSAYDVELVLNRMAAILGPDRPANELRTDDIVEAIRPTYERGSPSMADHMRGYMRSAFGWAIRSRNDYRTRAADRYRLKANPAEHIPTEPKVAGERWLSTDEMGRFLAWEGTKHINRNTDPRNYTAVRFIMATGQRSEEVARLHISMIDRERMLIDWPKTKNGRAHVLPLTPYLLDLLDSVKPNEHGLLFSSEALRYKPVTDQTLRKVCVSYCADTRARYFTPRDLRRTWKTWAGHAGLTKEDRDRLQNHARSDVSSVHYDRYDYLREKRAAMNCWCEWYLANVVNKKAPVRGGG